MSTTPTLLTFVNNCAYTLAPRRSKSAAPSVAAGFRTGAGRAYGSFVSVTGAATGRAGSFAAGVEAAVDPVVAVLIFLIVGSFLFFGGGGVGSFATVSTSTDVVCAARNSAASLSAT